MVAASADGAAPSIDTGPLAGRAPTPFAGDLGVTAAVTSVLPVRVAQVSAGFEETCAVLGDGTLRCWGRAHVLDGGVAAVAAPVEGVRDVAQVAVGGAHRSVRTRGGAVRCWGDNSFGELGDGTTTQRGAPIAVPLPAAAAEVVAGDGVTCARLVDGSAWCWGRNSVGEAGDGTTEQRLSLCACAGSTT